MECDASDKFGRQNVHRKVSCAWSSCEEPHLAVTLRKTFICSLSIMSHHTRVPNHYFRFSVYSVEYSLRTVMDLHGFRSCMGCPELCFCRFNIHSTNWKATRVSERIVFYFIGCVVLFKFKMIGMKQSHRTELKGSLFDAGAVFFPLLFLKWNQPQQGASNAKYWYRFQMTQVAFVKLCAPLRRLCIKATSFTAFNSICQPVEK